MNLVKRVFSEFSKDNCTTLAAALAFYTAFSLPPLLFLLLTILTLGLSVAYEGQQAESDAQAVLESQAARLIGNQDISKEISAILENTKLSGGKWWKTLLSFAGILVGATGVVAALQAALNQVWSVQPDPEKAGWTDMIWKRLTSLAMILGLAFLLLVSLIVSSVLAALGDQVGSLVGMSSIAVEAVNFAVQAIVVFVVFAAIFKFMPDAIVQWRDVAIGAALTTVLFLVGRFAMQVYFSHSQPGADLGAAAASLAVLLVWVYYSAAIVLLGAEATQVYAVTYGSGIRPKSHALKVERQLKQTVETN